MKRLVWMLALAGVVGTAEGAEPHRLSFSLGNERAAAVEEVARVSLPVPAGWITGEPCVTVSGGGERIAAQAAVITRHGGGSVRRMMLSFPVRIAAKRTVDFSCEWSGSSNVGGASLAAVKGTTAEIRTDVLDLRLGEGLLEIRSKSGKVLGEIRALGPTLAGQQPPTLAVLENGTTFAWLRWEQDGSDYRRQLDVQADKLGRVRLVQRILRHLKDNGWTPEFGFELTAAGAEAVRVAPKPVRYSAVPAAEPLAKHPELVAAIRLADGTAIAMANPLALRQHRGILEASRQEGSVRVRLSRTEPVTKEMDNLQLQEGMWRTHEMLLEPGSAEHLAAGIDAPLVAKVDWRLYDAVYGTGPALEVHSPVLRALAEKYVTALERLELIGDDLGSLGGLERYNHCQYVWEDFFRTGDPRLRRVALEYSENYRDYSVYWGPKREYYGGGRYPPNAKTQPWPGSFRTRQNDAVTFCTKGYHSFWLAYEETGDPRFREAAEAQAQWSADHVHATVNYTRCIGQVTDFVKLYEYTGKKEYLEQAVRLWGEFQACQNPDLLFNEAGVPSTGNDLYVPEDSFGYKHPYVKSYIMQYATNALPCLLKYRPDDKRLRDTILACDDWMARVQTAGGGWSYPGPTTAGFHWNIEYCHGLMLGYEVQSKESYLEGIQRDLRAIVALYEKYGEIPGGVTPWEYVAGKSAVDLGKMYRLGSDRDRKRDFTDGRVEFGGPADQVVYFQVLVRDYLRHRPEESLFTRDETLERILKMPASLPAKHRGK